MGKAEERALQEKVDLLARENDQMRRKLMLLSGGGQQTGSMTLGSLTSFGASRVSSPQATIAGLSVAFLIVDRRWRVIRMNTPMADFIGTDKNLVTAKPPLEKFDTLEWAPGVFRTLLQDALDSQTEEIFESERQDALTGRPEYFQFKAVWSEGQGTMTVENVTRLRTTRLFFERLVSPRIVERLLDASDDPFLSHKRQMSVLFGDLRSFTNFCEAVDASIVQTVYNEFLEICMKAIDANDATLDKFIGDQVMVLCGAPLPVSGHAYHAVKVAVDLQQAMQFTRRNWIKQGLLPPALLEKHPEVLTLGIGINTAEMLIGMFGSERVSQYTVLGHPVNLAARLCSFAAGDEVLTSLDTVQAISRYARENPERIGIPIKFRTKAQIEVKGIAEPVTVATLAYQRD